MKTDILAYYSHTQKADKISKPELFKLNSIPHDEKLVKLAILREKEQNSKHTVADLPTNKDVIDTLDGTFNQREQPSLSSLKLNELCIVVW